MQPQCQVGENKQLVNQSNLILQIFLIVVTCYASLDRLRGTPNQEYINRKKRKLSTSVLLCIHALLCPCTKKPFQLPLPRTFSYRNTDTCVTIVFDCSFIFHGLISLHGSSQAQEIFEATSTFPMIYTHTSELKWFKVILGSAACCAKQSSKMETPPALDYSKDGNYLDIHCASLCIPESSELEQRLNHQFREGHAKGKISSFIPLQWVR